MMLKLAGSDRPSPAIPGGYALAAGLVLCLAACEMTPGSAIAQSAPFVLTTRGDAVLANSPPGIEVTLGAKRVRPADEPVALD